MFWGGPRWLPNDTGMSGEAALIWCPFPDPDSARQAARMLLDQRLIACGNIVPGVQSLFCWGGERGENAECGLLCKTTAARLRAAMAQLRALHPYDTPAILGWKVHADEDTLAWLDAETDAP